MTTTKQPHLEQIEVKLRALTVDEAAIHAGLEALSTLSPGLAEDVLGRLIERSKTGNYPSRLLGYLLREDVGKEAARATWETAGKVSTGREKRTCWTVRRDTQQEARRSLGALTEQEQVTLWAYVSRLWATGNPPRPIDADPAAPWESDAACYAMGLTFLERGEKALEAGRRWMK